MYECLRLKLRAMVSPPVSLHGQTRNMCGTESQVLAKQTVHVTLPARLDSCLDGPRKKKPHSITKMYQKYICQNK